MSAAPPLGSGPYRIGAVAALSGLPTNTIRTWERRYGVVSPERSEGGGRLYNDADVERLLALRRLTEQGHSISDLAGLKTKVLVGMLSTTQGVSPFRVGVSDVQLAARLRKLDENWRIDPILDLAGIASFRGRALVLNLSDLGPHPVEQAKNIRKDRPLSLYIIYEFAPRQILEDLASTGALTLRGPLRELKTLQRLIRLTSDRQPPAPLPARRYDLRELNRLLELNNAIECECPQHLAALIKSLLAFEDYSRSCESNSVEDADLHAYLASGTGAARQKMEGLLTAVIEAEGLSAHIA